MAWYMYQQNISNMKIHSIIYLWPWNMQIKIIRRSRPQGGQGHKDVKISKIMIWVNKLHLYWIPGLNLSWQFQKLPCLQLASFPQRSLVTTVSFTGLQDNQTDHWADAKQLTCPSHSEHNKQDLHSQYEFFPSEIW